MTHRARTLILFAAFSWLLMGCSANLVPFTQELRSRHDLSDGDLEQLQYYVSHDVTLRREARTTGRDISSGNLKIREGKTIEEIVIAQHTPGVAVDVHGHAITISFAEGSELVFSLRTGEPMPLRKTSGHFSEPPEAFPGDHTERRDNHTTLDEVLGNYWLDSNSDSMVVFQGRQWNGMGETFRAHLVIDSESLEEIVETRSVLGGRTVASRNGIRVTPVN